MARSERRRRKPERRGGEAGGKTPRQDERQPAKRKGAEAAGPEAATRARLRKPWLLGAVAALAVVVAGAGWLLVRSARQPAVAGANREAPLVIAEVADLGELDPAVAKAIEEEAGRVHQHPRDPQAHGELGRLYHAHKHIDLARSSYETARQLDPRVPDWPYYLGLFAADRGELDLARAHFERVVDLQPDYAPAWYHLGNALLSLGRLDDTERAFARVVSLAPDGPWGYLGLGRLERRRERWPAAGVQLEQALERDPDHRETIYLLAMTRRELGQEAEARSLLSRLPGASSGAIADPILARALERRTDLESLNQSANRLVAAGDSEAAEALYLTLLETDPRHYDALYNLGLLYNRSGRYEEADQVLRRAAGARPESADAQFLLAMTNLSLDREAEALPYLERALELDPEHALARDLKVRLTPPP